MRILAAALVLVAACGGGGVGPTPRPTFTTVRVMLADAQVRAEVVRYPSDGLSVAGIVRRPVAPGKYPILMLNHGGWGGLGGRARTDHQFLRRIGAGRVGGDRAIVSRRGRLRRDHRTLPRRSDRHSSDA